MQVNIACSPLLMHPHSLPPASSSSLTAEDAPSLRSGSTASALSFTASRKKKKKKKGSQTCSQSHLPHHSLQQIWYNGGGTRAAKQFPGCWRHDPTHDEIEVLLLNMTRCLFSPSNTYERHVTFWGKLDKYRRPPPRNAAEDVICQRTLHCGLQPWYSNPLRRTRRWIPRSFQGQGMWESRGTSVTYRPSEPLQVRKTWRS